MVLPVLDNLKHSITQIVKIYNIDVSGAPTGRPLKIQILDALALALYQHQSTRATKISVYRDLQDVLHCSYKTFVVSINNVARLAGKILMYLMQANATIAHMVKYTDATDLPVCLKKNADKHKVINYPSFFS